VQFGKNHGSAVQLQQRMLLVALFGRRLACMSVETAHLPGFQDPSTSILWHAANAVFECASVRIQQFAVVQIKCL
jgi:hypothetical protein